MILQNKIRDEISRLERTLELYDKKSRKWGLTEEDKVKKREVEMLYISYNCNVINILFEDNIECYLVDDKIEEFRKRLKNICEWGGNAYYLEEDIKDKILLKIDVDNYEEVLFLLKRISMEETNNLYIYIEEYFDEFKIFAEILYNEEVVDDIDKVRKLLRKYIEDRFKFLETIVRGGVNEKIKKSSK